MEEKLSKFLFLRSKWIEIGQNFSYKVKILVSMGEKLSKFWFLNSNGSKLVKISVERSKLVKILVIRSKFEFLRGKNCQNFGFKVKIGQKSFLTKSKFVKIQVF